MVVGKVVVCGGGDVVLVVGCWIEVNILMSKGSDVCLFVCEFLIR